MSAGDIRNRAWFSSLSQRLGSSQLTHAVARLESLERIERNLPRWLELLDAGKSDELRAELVREVRR